MQRWTKSGEAPMDVGTTMESIGSLNGGNGKSWRESETVLRATLSVVGLSSFTGIKELFCCSGSIIHRDDMAVTILTSATLLKGYKDTIASDLRVEVHLPTGQTLSGTPIHHDLYHNITVLTATVPKQYDSAVVQVNFQQDPQFLHPGRDVVALGHCLETSSIMSTHGEINIKSNELDSEDLLSSSCTVSRDGIGGPLIDFESGEVLGMNFIGREATPFLPSAIVLKCLHHFKSYGIVIRPLLGLKIVSLDTLKIDRLERIFDGLQRIYPNSSDAGGVFVDKVEDLFPEDTAGISAGDVITECEGKPICSPVEFASIQLDNAEKYVPLINKASGHVTKRRAISVEVVILKNSSGSKESRSIIVQDLIQAGEKNWWPLPKTRSCSYYVGGGVPFIELNHRT